MDIDNQIFLGDNKAILKDMPVDLLPRLNVVGFWGQAENARIASGLTSPSPRVEAPTLKIL